MDDVYVAGFEYDGTKNVAKIWKNGIATLVSNSSNSTTSNSVFVHEGNVYVAGREYSNFKYIAKAWKNGSEIFTTNVNNNANATSIFVK